MAEQIRLRKLKNNRSNSISEIQYLLQLAERTKTDKTVRSLFKVRCAELDVLKDDFIKQHQNIISSLANEADTDLEPENVIRTAFFNDFYVVKSMYVDLCEIDTANSQKILNYSMNATTSGTSNEHNYHIKPPNLDIPKFNGDYRTFSTFIDLYNALIHNNPTLTPIEKFRYLLSLVEGKPLGVVSSLPMTSDNYQTTYDNFVDRYSNVRFRAQSHWYAIKTAPKAIRDQPESLRNLLDTFSQNLASLKNLNFPIESWDFILVNMLLERVDDDLITRFELSLASGTIPKFKELFEFLEKCCKTYESLNLSLPLINNKRSNKIKSPLQPRRTTSLLAKQTKNSNSGSCLLCNEMHSLYNCSTFLSKTPQERYQLSKRAHLCVNCLSNIHSTQNCKSAMSCRKCNQRHHTLLHFSSSNIERATHSPESALPSTSRENSFNNKPHFSGTPSKTVFSNRDENSSLNQSFAATGLLSKSTSVLLGTAVIEVLDKFGIYQSMRCLLDPGSMTSFITEKSANTLGLPKERGLYEIQGLDNMVTNSGQATVTLSFRPLNCPESVLNTDAIVLPKICDSLPTAILPASSWSHLSNLKLADPKFYVPGPIDILLGADVYTKIILNGCVRGIHGEPDLLNTIFGYVPMGKIGTFCETSTVTSFFCNSHKINTDDILTKFWEVESVPLLPMLSDNDLFCEEHFLKTYQRNSDGKFVVHLPFRDNFPTFPGIRQLAEQRFLSLERRLLKDQELYKSYCQFMKEYLDLGHMKPVSHETELSSASYYIPHHCVLKPQASSTKLRVVFNGSAKLPNQTSLNDHLFTGPKLQKDIVELLIQFRFHVYVLCTDIKMMYRNILITSSQHQYQRIVWRFSRNDPLQDYELITVVYGLSPSPFLALRALQQLVLDEGADFPLASHAISNHTYVDDVVTGATTFSEALALKNELIALFSKAGFDLRKWASNDPNLLSDLPSDFLSTTHINFDDPESSLKILGLQWNPTTDNFHFHFNSLDRPCTKRNMLSELARIFDPLGFLAPVTFFTKTLIQKLWSSHMDWDQQPPDEIIRIWTRYKNEMHLLSQIDLPRKILFSECENRCELHGFCDASEKGYAAVVYLRILRNNKKIEVHLVASKTKVAPLKKLTIPRLELCAAVLLAKLLAYLVPIFKTKISLDKIITWSDSNIVLYWLHSPPSRWKTFVANRVSYIQDKLPHATWLHVKSKNNPADVASRGIFPSEFVNFSTWFQGPSFLHDPDALLGSTSACATLNSTSEEEKHTSFFAATSEENFIDLLLEKYSSFATLQRTVAYVLRFLFNIKNPRQKRSGPLLTVELNESFTCLVKRTQSICFQSELISKSFSKPLRKLNPFIDEQGIVRVGGRLKHSTLSYSAKYPILLPRSSLLTRHLIYYYHLKYLHAGLRTLLFLLSQSVWILSPKRAINSVIHSCLICWRSNPKPFQPQMGNLPPSRVSQLKAFTHTGVDFAGPFLITMNRYRGAKTTKAYICLFICFATKAMHLELVSSLSTEAFLGALQRFLSRRGRCTDIYSDCGTNFVGASKEIKTMFESAVEHENIQWHFNPPAAPHFGGLWEAGVRSVKTHLGRVIGQQVLTFEELYTTLTLIEAVLNSRPLNPISSDVEDINALTPGHFLTLEPLNSLPTPNFTAVPINRLSRWQLLQRLHRDFWNRWHKEYLHSLQQRQKWLNSSDAPSLGTLVIIKNENAPPCQWTLGRIISLSEGTDGVVRVALVRTAKGTLQRPLVKLCPLPSN